jgi:hypothetical protein
LVVSGSPGQKYERPSIPELRQLLAVEGLERLLRRTFKPARGEAPVSWLEASARQHRMRAETQSRLAESIEEDASRHELFAAAIEATEGAVNFADVRKAWKI